MARFAPALLLSVTLAATPAFAQPAPAGEFETAYAAFDAAAARERAALAARAQAFSTMQAREAEALRVGAAEHRAREAQARELERLRAEASALLDRLEANQRRPFQLLLERAVLQDSYDTLQPVVAHLTERSFRGLEVELAALAAAGQIEPGTRRFRSYAELRSRIVELNRRMAALAAERSRAATALRSQVQALELRRRSVLAQIVQADPAGERAAQSWLESGGELQQKSRALEAARRDVEQAAARVLAAAGRLRPAVLADVVARVDGQQIYGANWRRGTAAGASEQQREQRRQELRRLRQDFENAADEFAIVLRERHELRSAAAESMHGLSGMLQRSAARYAAALEFQVIAAAALDIGLTTAEVFLTGGAATLARKGTELGQQAAARAALRRAAVSRPTTAEAARIARHAWPGDRLADSLRTAATRGVGELQEEAGAKLARLIAGGMSREAAERSVRLEFAPMIERLQLLERSNRLANQVSAEALADARRLDLLPDMREALGSIAGTAVEKAVPAAPSWYSFLAGARESNAAAPRVDTVASTAASEAFELAVAQGANTISATASQASGVLGRAAAMRTSYLPGLEANKLRSGFAVVSGAYQIAVAGMLDASVNAEAAHYGDVLARLEHSYAIYRAQLEADQALGAYVAELRNSMLKIDVALAMLDAGATLKLLPTNVVPVSKDGSLELDLVFTAPLAAPPLVSVAAVPLAMQRADGSGLRWRGTVPVRRLGAPGAKPVSVGIGAEQSLHGSLDRDPATPALRLKRGGGWSGFETGNDTHHVLPLVVRGDEPRAAPPADVDPFEEGRALVDGREPAPSPLRASDLVGAWIASGYFCNGAEPDQSIFITAVGQRLTATKVRGDRCIRSGEVTWRGTLAVDSIDAEIHLRAMDAPISDENWSPGKVEVVSRNEMRGFGVTYRRE